MVPSVGDVDTTALLSGSLDWQSWHTLAVISVPETSPVWQGGRSAHCGMESAHCVCIWAVCISCEVMAKPSVSLSFQFLSVHHAAQLHPFLLAVGLEVAQAGPGNLLANRTGLLASCHPSLPGTMRSWSLLTVYRLYQVGKSFTHPFALNWVT
jgi:hypothetical protein